MIRKGKAEEKQKQKYDLKHTLEILEIYRNNGYNACKTERDTGVTKDTIRKWAVKHGYDQKRKDELEKIREDVVKEMAVANVSYIETAQRIRMAVLEKLELKIPNTNSVHDLIKIGMFTNDVLSQQGGVTPPTVNFFNQINQKLIQNNITIQEDEANN